jgi:hypothetical protein
LVDVNVLDTGIVCGMLNGKGEGERRDSLSLKPRDALEPENFIGAVAEGLVLSIMIGC